MTYPVHSVRWWATSLLVKNCTLSLLGDITSQAKVFQMFWSHFFPSKVVFSSVLNDGAGLWQVIFFLGSLPQLRISFSEIPGIALCSLYRFPMKRSTSCQDLPTFKMAASIGTHIGMMWGVSSVHSCHGIYCRERPQGTSVLFGQWVLGLRIGSGLDAE